MGLSFPKAIDARRHRARTRPRYCGARCRVARVQPLESRRLLAVADLDTAFGNQGIATSDFNLGGLASAAAIDHNNKIVVVGQVQHDPDPGNISFGVVRFNPDGMPDTSFGPAHDGLAAASDIQHGFADYFPTAVAIDSANRVVVAGYSQEVGVAGPMIQSFVVMRFNTDGSVDKTFGAGGLTPEGEQFIQFAQGPGGEEINQAAGVAIDGHGNIVVVGTVVLGDGTSAAGLVKLTETGAFDQTFGSKGFRAITGSHGENAGASSVAIEPISNDIIIAGDTTVKPGGMYAVKLLPDGNPDPTFHLDYGLQTGGGSTNGGNDNANSVAVDAQGRIYLAGTLSGGGGASSVEVIRMKPDGDRDGGNSFAWAKGASGGARSALIDQRGRLVLVGSGVDSSGNHFLAAARLNDDGSFDKSFAGSGVSIVSAAGISGSTLDSAAIDQNGQLVIAGSTRGSVNQFAVARLIANQAPMARDNIYVLSDSPSSSVDAAHGALSNDHDPDGDPLQGGSVSQAAHGTLDGKVDGSFTYTPGPDFNGFDRVSYTANDGYMDSNPATVTFLSHTAGVVWKFYESMLDRAPDDQGLSYWTDQFNRGVPLSKIAVSFFAGDELQKRVITDYYLQYLAREPDQAGLNYWKAKWTAAGGPEDVQAGFASSREFTQQNNNTASGWVKGLYEKILDRDPEPSGLAYWTGQVQQLDAHDRSSFVADELARENVADRILKSPEEYRAIIVPGWFDQFVQRQPTAAELTKYVGELLAGTFDRTVEQQIIDQADAGDNVPRPASGTGAAFPDFYYIPLVEQMQNESMRRTADLPEAAATGGTFPARHASVAARDALFSQLGER